MMEQSSAAYGGMRPVATVHHGWLVLSGLNVVAGGLRSNADDWAWIDRHSTEGRTDYDRHYRIQSAFATMKK
jgi:hypothetical protein